LVPVFWQPPPVFANPLNCLFDWIGEQEEDASPTRNKYKVRSFRMAFSAIEKLDFRVRHGDELKKVRSTTSIPSFVTSKSVFRFTGESYWTGYQEPHQCIVGCPSQ
jgi:hypothetical protein